MHAECGDGRRRDGRGPERGAARGGRIVAVGTTSLRLLESAAGEDGTIGPFAGETASSSRRAIASAPSTC